MSETEAGVAISAVADALKKHIRPGSPDPIIVSYELLDSENQFPSGQTENYIEDAAKQIGYVVSRKGTTRASLTRDPSQSPSS